MRRLKTTFRLPCGVEAECYQLYGEHYEILTRPDQIGEDKMTNFILALLVRLGSVAVKNDENGKELVRSMRAEDKRHLLAVVRQATMDYEKDFQFIHKWVDAEGNNIDTPLKVTLNEEGEKRYEHIKMLCEVYGEADIEFYQELNKDGTFRTTPSVHRGSEYADLEMTYLVTLPKSGTVVKVAYLSGKGEAYLANKPKAKLDTNTLLEARFPKYLDGSAWINLNLKETHARDLEYLRGEIKKHEGAVEMELRFLNPDPTASDKDKYIKKDLIQETSFFYPSGALG